MKLNLIFAFITLLTGFNLFGSPNFIVGKAKQSGFPVYQINFESDLTEIQRDLFALYHKQPCDFKKGIDFEYPYRVANMMMRPILTIPTDCLVFDSLIHCGIRYSFQILINKNEEFLVQNKVLGLAKIPITLSSYFTSINTEDYSAPPSYNQLNLFIRWQKGVSSRLIHKIIKIIHKEHFKDAKRRFKQDYPTKKWRDDFLHQLYSLKIRLLRDDWRKYPKVQLEEIEIIEISD